MVAAAFKPRKTATTSPVAERVFFRLDLAQEPVAQPRPFLLPHLTLEDGLPHARRGGGCCGDSGFCRPQSLTRNARAFRDIVGHAKMSASQGGARIGHARH